MKHDASQDDITRAYDEYSDAIFRHCYFRIFDRELAKELMQETFVKTWQYVQSGKTVDNLRAFLYRIANNLIIDHVRSKKKRHISLDALQDQGFDVSHDPTSSMKDAVDEQFILEVFDKIDPLYRDILIMRYIDELTPREIASLKKLSPNVVSVRANRGMKQLRLLLKQK